MSDPRKASSVWPEMSCMRGPEGAERLHRLVPLLRANRDACAARREAVLRHDWARRRLCHILTIARPDQWNGYVPPAGASPTRRALVALLAEVDEHEREMHEIGGGA